MPMSHDQNFKNLILAYPREALAFFLPEEGFTLDGSFTVRPLRQELPKRRLGDRFFEMDTPLRVSWPGGEREDMVVLFEEESVPSRFSPLRSCASRDAAETTRPPRAAKSRSA